jgi:hypothetical protein
MKFASTLEAPAVPATRDVIEAEAESVGVSTLLS